MSEFRIVKYVGVTKDNIWKFEHGKADFEEEVLFQKEIEKKYAKAKFNEIQENGAGTFTDSLLSLERFNGERWAMNTTYTDID